jgi:hypothetical protein
MVGKVGKAKISVIEKMGEDEVLDRISTGTSVRSLMKEFDVGYKLFAMWLDAVEGRRGRYDQALSEAGNYYAERAVDTAQNAQPEDVNVSRLKVDTDKWIASKLNHKYDTRQRDVAINISVNDLHAQAAQLLGDVIEGEAEEVEP